MTKQEASAGVDILDQALLDVASGLVGRNVLTAFEGW
jgi:hypothetical protein